MPQKFALAVVLFVIAAPAFAQGGGDSVPEDAGVAEAFGNGGAGREETLENLASRLGVPVETLEAQRREHDLSNGQLFIANSLATAAGVEFDAVVAEFKSGRGWGAIARGHDVRLGDAVSQAVRAEQARQNALDRERSDLPGAGEARRDTRPSTAGVSAPRTGEPRGRSNPRSGPIAGPRAPSRGGRGR